MIISYFSTIKDNNGDCVGAISKTRSFMSGLAGHGHEVHINWLEGPPDGKLGVTQGLPGLYHPTFKAWLVRLLHEPKRVLKNLIYGRKIKSLIDEQKPDVLYERHLWSGIATALWSRWKSIPLVVEADAPAWYEYSHFYGSENVHIPWLPQWLERFTLRQARAIFAISNVLKNHMVEDLGIEAEKIHVISNGADPDIFYPTERDADIEAELDLAGKTVVGWIGSSITWSGFESFIATVKRLLETRDDVCFLFVGGIGRDLFLKHGLAPQQIEKSIKLPGVVAHGELNKYLSCMDVVLAPYPKLDLWWASSMKVFEYMCAGKPVITTDVGQLGEVVKHGRSGLLLPDNGETALFEAISRLVDDKTLRESMGQRAREDVLKHHTWEVLSGRMSQVFEQVLAESRRGTDKEVN